MKLDIRSAGILAHPTSLPGSHGIGDLGPAAYKLAETLAGCGQSWWQMLPITPPGMGNSPYMSLSAFAGNPMLLSLDLFAEEGYLEPRDLETPEFPEDRVDFAAVERFKRPRLLKAFEFFKARGDSLAFRDFEAFRETNAAWVEDYALFSALRDFYRCLPWTAWDEGLRSRDPQALARAREELREQARFHCFLQYQFSRQWAALKRHCGRLKVGLIGDIPIFVAHDSADVWAHPELFWLNASGRPLKMAGVPPDYFSKTGQLWGNPLYRWEVMRPRRYGWWISRLRVTAERFDAVRLDHFIGFHNYWEIPEGSPTAERGRWVPGPGADFFSAVEDALGKLQLIAEDLGVVTPGVKALRDRFGLPGIRVLQMAFGTDPEADNYKPHVYPRNCVAYTGTHDNDTTVGWFSDAGRQSSTRTPVEIEREHAAILRYLGTDGREIHWDMIRLALMSAADTAIIPVQDILGLGSHARMNLPGTAEGNWAWRFTEGALCEEIAGRLATLTRRCGRQPKG